MRRLAALLVPLALACGDSPTDPGGDWGEVFRAEGEGSKQTASFDVDSREWRIRWESTGADGLLLVTVYTFGGEYVDLAINHLGPGSDTTYIHADPGRFYLDVLGIDTSWVLRVEAPG